MNQSLVPNCSPDQDTQALHMVIIGVVPDSKVLGCSPLLAKSNSKQRVFQLQSSC